MQEVGLRIAAVGWHTVITPSLSLWIPYVSSPNLSTLWKGMVDRRDAEDAKVRRDALCL